MNFDVVYRHVATVKAPIEFCFDRLVDHARLHEIYGGGNWSVRETGPPESNGIGTIRGNTSPDGREVLERINFLWRPYLLGYQVVGDPPLVLKDHQGVITLHVVPEGTEINFHTTGMYDDPLYVDVWKRNSERGAPIAQNIERLYAAG